MPILLRIIAQRLITAMLTFLTFLGLAPEATIPTDSEVEFRIEEQRKIVEQVLELKTTQITAEGYEKENIVKIIDNAASKINEKREEIENTTNKQPRVAISDEIEKVTTQIAPEIDIFTDQKNSTETQSNTTKQEDPSPAPAENQMKSLADVIVNIICTEKGDGFTKASTGSGVLISPDGVVVTNAHVAHMFLLEDNGDNVECSIYRENIPTFGYRADLIYISSDWVMSNRDLIFQENPRGTGEKDYAFLQITANTNPVLGLPTKFSYANIMLNNDIYVKDRKISIGGFPGSPISLFDLTKAGSLKTDNSSIKDVFTINGDTIDIFSTQKTSVAAKGASGGGVFYNNNLIGLTVTISNEGNGSKINAITTTYINSDLRDEAGFSFEDILGPNVSTIRENFQNSTLEELASFIYRD
jgi:hypothetical protein